MIKVVFLEDEQATLSLGQALGMVLCEGGVVFLEGTLGAGKTTLTRGVLSGLGHSGSVKSPTYTLVEPYELRKTTVFHFDLYRLGDPEELEFMGIRDYFSDNHLCIVEWPEKGAGVLPEPDLVANLQVKGAHREIRLQAINSKGERVLTLLGDAV